MCLGLRLDAHVAFHETRSGTDVCSNPIRVPSSKVSKELPVPQASRRVYTTTTTQIYEAWPSTAPEAPSTTRYASGLLGLSLTKGGPIKDFRLKMRLGEYAGSPLQVSETSLITQPLHATSKSKDFFAFGQWRRGQRRTLKGTSIYLPVASDPGAPIASVANTAALTRLSKRISDEMTTFQGGVFAGEIKETVHMIRHPLQALRSGLIGHLQLVAKRAKRIRKVKNMAKMVAATWLETSYGLRPLLADIDDASDVLAQFLVNPRSREFKTLTAYGSDERAVDERITNVNMSFAGTIWAHVVRKRTYTVKYLACIGVQSSVRPQAFQKVGITFANFVPTLYELIPYSFVVDYFSNFGDIVSGLANLSANVRWVMRWDIDEDIEEGFPYQIPLQPNSGVAYQTCSGGYQRFGKRTINRGLYQGSLIPDFRFEIPGTSSLKWANLAALTAQLVLTRSIVQTPVRNRLTLLRKGQF